MKAILLLFLLGTIIPITNIQAKISNQPININQEKKKAKVEFSNVKEKKDENSNTIFSFRITNNNEDKKIVSIKFQYESTMFDLMSSIKETRTENRKISISPKQYSDYSFKINYDPKNEGYSYRLYIVEVIYEDGSSDKGRLQLY